MDLTTEVQRGRAAFAASRWADASRWLESAEQAGPLGFEELEMLAVSACLAGRDETSLEAWSRGHRAGLTGGDPAGAARCAFWLVLGLLQRGEMAPAAGWLARAQRVLDDAGIDDCAERGFLLVVDSLLDLMAGEAGPAYAASCRAAAIATRCGNADLAALAGLGQGQALIVQGEQSAATALLDEVMVAVTAGEVSALVAGLVYCAVIEACHDAFDVERARQWTAALTRWCDAQPELALYRGQCLVHRTEVLALEGDWTAATAEAQRACAVLGGPPVHPAVGAAHYQHAELLRMRGALAAAEVAYRSASGHGFEPQPGLALLRLAQGDPVAAATALRRALVEAVDELRRARLLPAMVEVLLAAGELEDAESSAAELSELARRRAAPALLAGAHLSAGAVHLACGRTGAALTALRAAETAWRALGAPYEAARARALLAQACRQLGDGDGAALELAAARRTFDQLGAATDLAALGAAGPEALDDTVLTRREAEVLALVATGVTNRQIATELVISEKTVARHLANIYTKLGLSSRAAATAYAYQHKLL
jgi:ATP/maltotriose-dependent transcriptional regulator MalT